MANAMERWAASFDPKVKEVWMMENRNDVYLYCTKDKISAQESNPFRHTDPMWHVWSHDRWVYCNANMQGAYKKYNEELMAG